MCRGDDGAIDRVLTAITRDVERRRQYLREIEEKAEAFVDEHWQQILKLGKETYRRGRLDRDEIAAVLTERASPPSSMVARAMPRKPGDPADVFRRAGGFFR
jgi:hypothetical protein